MCTTHNVSSVVWRKSSYSDGQGGSCIEVAEGFAGSMPVRDSKQPHGPQIHFPAAGWVAFVDAVKDGSLATS